MSNGILWQRPRNPPTRDLRFKSARRQELEQRVHEPALGAGRAPLHDALVRALEHKLSADRAKLPCPLHPGRRARRTERERPFEKVRSRRREHEERGAVELCGRGVPSSNFRARCCLIIRSWC